MWQISFLAIFSTKWLRKLQKTWRAGQTTLKFCVHKVKILYRKSLENMKIIWAALHCENGIWNKQIFATSNCSFDQVSNIETDISCTIQLVPKHLSVWHCSQSVMEPYYGYNYSLWYQKVHLISEWCRFLSMPFSPTLLLIGHAGGQRWLFWAI